MSVSYQLEQRVVDIIALEEWEGCRDAVRDYIKARVEGTHQYGWIRTVQAWIDGGLGTPKGFDVDRPAQNKIVALACNELLATEERGMVSSRGKLGETGTLRTKIEYLIRRGVAHGGGPTSGAGRHAGNIT